MNGQPGASHPLTGEDGVAAALAAAAAGRPFCVRLEASAALEVTGPDSVSFLHGQLANDVSGLEVGATNRSLLLNHKGHALAEAQVLRLERERLLVVVDDGRLPWVRETLERHVVFDEVALSEVPAAVVTLQGAAAAAVLGRALADIAGGEPLPAPAGAAIATVARGAGVHAYAVERSEAGGFDLLALAGGEPGGLLQALERAGAVAVDDAARDAARVVAGVPAAGREGGDGVLPQEAGLGRFVSFRKGCYLGQEIMARIEARGAVRRGLRTLELQGEPSGAEVTAEGRVVGRLGTVARLPGGRSLALAVLRNDVPDGAAVSVGGVDARVASRATLRMPA